MNGALECSKDQFVCVISVGSITASGQMVVKSGVVNANQSLFWCCSSDLVLWSEGGLLRAEMELVGNQLKWFVTELSTVPV